MAHELDITNGTASFVSAHTAAWHQLGTVLDGKFTAEQAMEHGHLGGWDVRKWPAHAVNPDTGDLIAREGMFDIVRNNPVVPGRIDVLGSNIVSDGYQIIQNEEHAEFLDALVDESDAHFETAGALRGGAQVFLTMALPEHISIGGIDPVRNYIAAMNSHDGSMSFTLMVTPIRVVCANTMNLAFGNKSHVHRVRHTTNAHKNVRQQARQALDISFKYLEGFQAEAEALLNTEMTLGQFADIIEREFGAGDDSSKAAITRANNRIAEMLDLFEVADTQANIRHTAWAGLNALTEWSDHFSGVRGGDHDSSRAIKALFDPSFKNQALKAMLAAV
jgi:phage/plasmid-like protein (TIGR03299 family)